ncbi:MAG: MBL fold metallo-hydrolase [bacterium]|nr:MBL fold metallo-hydrolase [bacterium]
MDESVNIFAFIGSDGVVLIDSGFEETSDLVKSELRKFGKVDIKYIINTHADWDHISGNRSLGSDAVIIAHENSEKQISEYLALPDFPFDRTILENSIPSITFREKMNIHFNGEDIELIFMPGCHTDDDIIVYFKNAEIACMGDMFLAGTFPVVKLDNGGSINALMDNIEEIISMFPADIKFVFGHGIEYTKEDLKKYRVMITETIKIVTNAAKAGKTVEDMIKENILKDWESWSKTVFEECDSEKWIRTIFEGLNLKFK